MTQDLKPAKVIADPGSLLALEKIDPRQAEALWHGMSAEERLRAILGARGDDRLRLITLAQDSAALTQALPPDEFAGSILQMGPDQAAELLALSSDEQLTYLLDLTGWVKERFAPTRYQAWVPLLLMAGPERIMRWLAAADLEVLALLLAHWFEVVKYVPSSDEQEPPDNLPNFTVDGIYHLRFYDEKISALVAQVMVILKSEMPDLYGRTMEAMRWESAVQMSEYASRWRGGRMADHGFPSRLESLEIWAPAAPGETDWANLAPKLDLGFGADAPPRSNQFLDAIDGWCTLPQAVGEMTEAEADALRFELAHIANAAVVALDADPADPETVRMAAREGLGLANLGLELVAGDSAGAVSQVLRRVGLAALARAGAAEVRKLNQRATALLTEGWLKGIPIGLHVLDEPLDRWLAGLIYPRPRCYDPSLGQAREFRPFMTTADIERAQDALDQAEFMGVLVFDLLGMDRLAVVELLAQRAINDETDPIKLEQLITTWLARRALGMEGHGPIDPSQLGPAVAALQEGLAGALPDELLASCAALNDPTQASLAGRIMRGVLTRIKNELGRLDAEADLNPDLVGLILVRE